MIICWPQNHPLMISLYKYKLIFSLSLQLFWQYAWYVPFLEKKTNPQPPTKLPLETNMCQVRPNLLSP